MKETPEEAACRKRFVALYAEIKDKYGLTDLEFLTQLGFKTKTYISDLARGHYQVSFKLLQRLKDHYPEVDMNKIFQGPVPEVVELTDRRYKHTRRSYDKRLSPEMKQKKLAKLQEEKEIFVRYQERVLSRIQDIGLDLPGADKAKQTELKLQSQKLTDKYLKRKALLEAKEQRLTGQAKQEQTLHVNLVPGV